ncbi:uncharacterized protein LOC126737533 [Anthonomus grandis grandis]|uniref:uncharacterized protein LOC126737533 n=1 Tax=Anthonomus grandis grandis TaxID=2921223 RepID=UPI00216538A4|nr:uncharacterized protein LOC126737533 [Anthonomus grandis grandis]
MRSNLILFLTLHCLATSSFLKVATAIPFETPDELEKRISASDRINEDYPDYQLGVRYDEYPTIVPKKRTAMLVNRLMVALKDALEEDDRGRNGKPPGAYGNSIPEDVRSMDLQRRGHQSSITNGQNKARIYWRCYFNAVTCF